MRVKAIVLDLIGWIVVAHCWISGAMTFGISVRYWFGAGHFVAGLVVGLAFPAIPLILWTAVAADKRDRP